MNGAWNQKLHIEVGIEAGLNLLDESIHRGESPQAVWCVDSRPPETSPEIWKVDEGTFDNRGTLWAFFDSVDAYWRARPQLLGATSAVVVVSNEGLLDSLQLPVILVSPPKAGTHLATSLLDACGYQNGGELPLQPRAGCFYSLGGPSFHTEPVSLLNRYNTQGQLMGGQLLPIEGCLLLATFRHPVTTIASAMDFEFDRANSVLGIAHYANEHERWESFLNETSLHGSRIPFLNMYADWLRFPNVLPIAFEEFANPHDAVAQRAVWDLQVTLCVAGEPQTIISEAFGKSATYREGNISKRVQIPSEIEHRIVELTERYLAAAAGYHANEHDWWHEVRKKTSRPSDRRPKNIDLSLGRSGTHVFFYRDGRVIARSLTIDSDPSASELRRRPYLQASFDSLADARFWVATQAPRLRSRGFVRSAWPRVWRSWVRRIERVVRAEKSPLG